MGTSIRPQLAPGLLTLSGQSSCVIAGRFTSPAGSACAGMDTVAMAARLADAATAAMIVLGFRITPSLLHAIPPAHRGFPRFLKVRVTQGKPLPLIVTAQNVFDLRAHVKPVDANDHNPDDRHE